jgi:hypothetical protein
MRKILDSEVFGLCPTKDMLRFLFALCCSGGVSTLTPMDEQLQLALQKVQELVNVENSPLSGHLTS